MHIKEHIADLIRTLENARNQVAMLEGQAEDDPNMSDFGSMQIEDAVSDIDNAISKLAQAATATRVAA